MRKLHRRIPFLVAAAVASLAIAVPLIADAQTSSGPSRGGRGGQAQPPGQLRRVPKVPDVIDQFVDKVARARARGKSATALSNDFLHVTADGRIEMTFHSIDSITGAHRNDLRALGASDLVVAKLPAGSRGGVIQAVLPYDSVDEASELSWVSVVSTPGYGVADTHPTNANNSEGVALHNADDVQTRGINGTGVNVGVISDGVSNLAAAQTGNDLPAVTVLNAGGGDEGTAMLEIVHDMAPGAGLIFDTQGGVAGHANALNNLVTNGANVITEDLAFDTEPAFQQGLLATTGDNIAAGGVTVHSSAGNQALRHAARVTATGTGGTPDGVTFGTTPPTGCANTPDNVVAIAPGGDTTFDETLGNGGGSFTLQWSEPRAIFPTIGQGGFTDLNLYMMNAGLTQCLGQSTTVQANGQGDTIEQIGFGGGMGGTNVKLVVDVQGTSSAVAAPLLDLRWRGTSGGDVTTRAGAVNPDSNYIGLATSSAAVRAPGGALEGFSSGGPVTLALTTVCAAGDAPPCAGAAGPANTVAQAPAWAAADGVTVSGAGGFGVPAGGTPPGQFFGTSAAAPHAAGCDALLRDALNNAAAAPATTNARLQATSIDINAPGIDMVTGSGQLECLDAVNNPPVSDAGGPYTTDEGLNVALSGTGSSDPDAGDSIAAYAWDLDNDGAFDDSTSPTPTFTDVGQDGVFTVGLRVTDQAGATATDDSTVTVNNIAPTVTIGSDAPKDENISVGVTGLITDPGWEDDLSATVDWGDGTIESVTGTEENNRPDASLGYDISHTYGDNGTFTVTVCGADDDTTTCNTTPVQIDNVDPSADIDVSGATIINGIATILAHAGEPVDFDARSQDPGSDDLGLSWDWGDGGLSPDEAAISLVNPPLLDGLLTPSIQPRDVTYPVTHAFGDACLYTITYAATDDDGGSASDSAKVLITGNAERSRSVGYWQNEYRERNNADFTHAELVCYLEIVGYVSTVFNEETNASTVADAFGVLKPETTTAKEQFDRELLTVWLNFANGAIDYNQPLDLDKNGVNETTVAGAVAAAEAVRVNATSTASQLQAQRQILHKLNILHN